MTRRRKVKRFKVALISTAIGIGVIALFLAIDLDGDGLSNFAEFQHGTSMFNSDTDGDGLSDGVEVNTYKTNPTVSDTDGDQLNDYQEVYTYGTDPLIADMDADGLSDGAEIGLGTNPNKADTDDDGVSDFYDKQPTDFLGTISGTRLIRRDYMWEYPSERTWTWTVYLPQETYISYAKRDRLSDWSDWLEYTKDPTIEDLASGLNRFSLQAGFDYYGAVNFVLAFVQNMPYTEDDVTTGADEFPRYPIETLVDGGGDCEDTSFLVAGILREMGYDTALIVLPGHMAVGVQGWDYLGSYYLKDDTKYYYCETTGVGWRMGEIPSDYEGVSAILIEVISAPTSPTPPPTVTPNPTPSPAPGGPIIEDVMITVYYDSWEYDVKTSTGTRITWYLYDINKNLVHTYEETEYWSTNHGGIFGGYIPSGENGYIHLKAVSRNGDVDWWPSEDEMYKIEREGGAPGPTPIPAPTPTPTGENLTLEVIGDGIAEWTSEVAHSGDYSVKLTIPEGATSMSWAIFKIAYGKALSTLAPHSCYLYCNANLSTDPNFNLRADFVLYLDKTGDGKVDSLIFADDVYVGGREWIKGMPGFGWGWTEAPYPPYRYGDTWQPYDYWQSLYSDATVLYVAVGLEYWAAEPNLGVPLYVDDITINGITYDLEPS